jgi:ECL1/2/3 zinc binding proteins
MDWDHDTCLSCDTHIADGEKFCSQTCRLADLEQAGHSEQIAPSSLPANSPSWMSWQLPAQSTSSSRSQFQLAPAVNFSTYKTSSIESPPASPRSAMAPRQQSTSSYFAQTSTSSYQQPTGRGLTTSPSRSSLSSVSSTSSSSTSGISDHAANLLRAYSGAFDQDRNWKRRVTLG